MRSLTVSGAAAAACLLAYGLILRRQCEKNNNHNLNEVQFEGEEMDHAGLKNRVIRKAETVIRQRTSRIIIVIERCTDDHNYTAIIRTAEALGIQHIWLIDPVVVAPANKDEYDVASSARNSSFVGVTWHSKESRWVASFTSGGITVPLGKFDDELEAARAYDAHTGVAVNFPEVGDDEDVEATNHEHGMYARNATEWVTLREFRTTKECISALREDRRTIWATDLSQHAVRLTTEGLGSGEMVPERLAVVFGTESVGVTQEMLTAADKRVYLPLRGFADSLNLSVAAALVLQQLFHLCPSAVASMAESERRELRALWFPKLAEQRAGDSQQRKALGRIKLKLRDLQVIKNKRARDGPASLTTEQTAKFQAEKALRDEEAAIRGAIKAEAAAAVAKLVDDPPRPLTDLRRADEHRTAFVGRGVRKRNAEFWNGMAATANNPGHIKAEF